MGLWKDVDFETCDSAVHFLVYEGWLTLNPPIWEAPAVASLLPPEVWRREALAVCLRRARTPSGWPTAPKSCCWLPSPEAWVDSGTSAWRGEAAPVD